MRDLISRQAAIDALKEHRALFCDNTPDTFSKLSYGEKCRVDELDTAISTLVNLPSAQPTQTDTSNTLKALDCVERQAAIDALKRNTLRLTVAEEWNCEGHVAWDAEVVYSEVMEGMLLDLPSAQPNLQPTCNNLATDAAKKIIEQLPTQTNTFNALGTLDCINRQAAIDALEKWESELTWDKWCYDHKDEAEKYNIISPSSVVFGLPSALQERKTGKWIEQDDGWDGVYYECSVCKEAFTLIDGNPSDNLYNFCPNCGAKMEV